MPARELRQRDVEQLRCSLDFRSDPIKAKLRDAVALSHEGRVTLGLIERMDHERESSKTALAAQ